MKIKVRKPKERIRDLEEGDIFRLEGDLDLYLVMDFQIELIEAFEGIPSTLNTFIGAFEENKGLNLICVNLSTNALVIISVKVEHKIVYEGILIIDS